MSQDEHAVALRRVAKRFPGGVEAVRAIDLEIAPREFVSLIGPSGCGKSTLLRIVGELPSSIQDGLGGAILNFAQYYSFQPQNLWATNIIAALLGIAFFLAVVLAEKLVVRRAPEHVA